LFFFWRGVAPLYNKIALRACEKFGRSSCSVIGVAEGLQKARKQCKHNHDLSFEVWSI
jgi:hypothetical protein